MEQLNVVRVSLATGISAAALSILCWIVFMITPANTALWLVNALTHSLDLSSLIVAQKSFTGSIIGVVIAFILGALTGLIFSLIYNRLGSK